LPFANVKNQRSLVSLNNLVSLLVSCISHPEAAGELFLVADGEDLATPDLMRRLAHALGKSTKLFPVPLFLLRKSAQLLGMYGVCERLCGSLRIDASKARSMLGWKPVESVGEGLQSVATWYRHRLLECSH